jgi:hypothetical protein
MTEKTATQTLIEAQERWPQLRRQKAHFMVHAVMKSLDEIIDQDAMREACHRLFETFMDMGVDFLTDEDREKAGLEKRLEGGWTRSELQALEACRLQKLLEPIRMPFNTPYT